MRQFSLNKHLRGSRKRWKTLFHQPMLMVLFWSFQSARAMCSMFYCVAGFWQCLTSLTDVCTLGNKAVNLRIHQRGIWIALFSNSRCRNAVDHTDFKVDRCHRCVIGLRSLFQSRIKEPTYNQSWLNIYIVCYISVVWSVLCFRFWSNSGTCVGFLCNQRGARQANKFSSKRTLSLKRRGIK